MIYHNSECSKSQQSLAILHKTKHSIEVINYLETSLSEKDIKAICGSLNMKPAKIIRTKENTYESIAKKFEAAGDDEQCKIIAQNLILLERPIIMSHGMPDC